MTAFSDALAVVLELEGGRVNDPHDPGGRTNEGITQRIFDAWRRAHGQPTADVYGITAAEVAAIYRNAYADHVRFDDLPAGVGLCVLDDAVNSGPHEAAVELQRAVGLTGAALDGAIGDMTLAAVRRADAAALIGKLCDARLGYMRRLRTWTFFRRGWTARVAFVREKALKMAATHAPMQLPGAALAATSGKYPVVQSTGNPGQLPPCTRAGCPLAKAA